MQIQLDIGFNQLLQIVKTLPPAQLKRLKAEIEKKTDADSVDYDLENLLLKGPMATPKQLETIEENRQSFKKWRASKMVSLNFS